MLWANSVAYQLIGSADRFTFAWLVTETLGKSERTSGFVVFCLGLPIFLLVLPAGALSDRGNRRRQIFASQFAGAAVTAIAAVLVWTERMNVPLAAVTALGFGTAFAFAQPVRSALIQLLVPRHLLLKAIPIMTIGANLAMVVGPVLAGGSIQRWGVGAAFALQCALFLVSAGFISRLTIPSAAAGPRRDLRADITAGLRYAWTHPQLRTLFILMAVGGSVMMGPAFLLVPRVARVSFQREAGAAGALFGIMGIGMVVMSLLLLRIRSRLRRRGRLFMLCMVVGTSDSILQAVAPSYLTFALLMGIWGLTGGVWANMNQALIQEHTEPAMIGRVMSIVALLTTGLAPLSALLAGVIAEHIGPQETLGVFGAVGLSAVLVCIWRGRTLWHSP
jgi:MFS family permease